MKTIKAPLIAGLLFILLSFGNQNLQDRTIIGSWIEQKDTSSVWVFDENTLKIYYNNNLTRTYNYSISNSSPQCGRPVDTDSANQYLQIQDINNFENISCYQINGINFNGSGILSLTYFKNGKMIILNKS